MTDLHNPAIGRCQHCLQIRPVFHHDLRHDNGDHIWDTPYPADWPATGAWLCARDYSNAETARVNGLTYHVDHEIDVWPWRRHGTRIWVGGEEVLSQARRDLNTCNAILQATTSSTP
ncbi:hypothetical protein [Streptomyces sp. NPDC059783]|uniref:hypothetical protein n=1 Tax=Streptomyces sp. NPDC059783 TaxID=3346944 RepID=UPI003655E20A